MVVIHRPQLRAAVGTGARHRVNSRKLGKKYNCTDSLKQEKLRSHGDGKGIATHNSRPPHPTAVNQPRSTWSGKWSSSEVYEPSRKIFLDNG